MATNTTSTAHAAGGFSVRRWLEAAGLAMHATDFCTHGYVNYERCINLSQEDIHTVIGVNNDHNERLLVKRIKELRKLSEKDTVELLWVSTRN